MISQNTSEYQELKLLGVLGAQNLLPSHVHEAYVRFSAPNCNHTCLKHLCNLDTVILRPIFFDYLFETVFGRQLKEFMLRHEALATQVLIDLQELLCVLECSIFILLQRSLVELGHEGEVSEDELIGLR